MRKAWFGLLAASVSACGVSIPHPPYAPQATSALTLIDAEPPPGRIERVPDRPPGADAWIDGEWILRRGRWYWLLGRWVTVPHGARYAPWVVVRAKDGSLYYAPGKWVDGKGEQVSPPPALAVARANAEAVFDADGHVLDTGRSLANAPPQPPPEPPATR